MAPFWCRAVVTQRSQQSEIDDCPHATNPQGLLVRELSTSKLDDDVVAFACGVGLFISCLKIIVEKSISS